MAFLPVAMAVAATAMQAVGQIRQGQAANAAAQYNANVGRNNAVMAAQQAQSQAMIQGRRADMQQGQELASFAANGVDSGEGSPLDVLSQSFTSAEMDRQNTIYNGRVRAQSFLDDATLQGLKGKTALQNGFMSAAGTLLQGGGNAYKLSQGGPGTSLNMNG